MIAELAIDLGALQRNAARLARAIRPARYSAVVKANAYGHGLLEVARALSGDVALFCVYSVDEAATLRAGGIAAPLLILGPVEARELALAHECRAALTLWSEGSFRRAVARLGRSRGSPFAVHAKVDTGVTRLGLEAARATGVLADYCADPDLAVRGVYTHLAAAEELESAFTLAQLERFESATQPLLATFAQRGIVRHAAASAAGLLFPALRLDLVRAGIATYGIWPSPETQAAVGDACPLEPALAWTTQLVTVRVVESGRSIGYGCSFITQRPSMIGVLPIGYAEGLPRALSNAGFALVCGRRVRLVGRVCMNMSFVDVTDVPEVRPGSTVTLIGRDGAQAIDANELAAAAGTIGYELVARLPREVPRRYLAEHAASASPRSSVPS